MRRTVTHQLVASHPIDEPLSPGRKSVRSYLKGAPRCVPCRITEAE